jgi:hypothetical protein
MLIELRLDAGLGSGVDAKGFVVSARGHALGPERNILQEDARTGVFLPVKRAHEALQNSTNKKDIHSTTTRPSSTHSAKYLSCCRQVLGGKGSAASMTGRALVTRIGQSLPWLQFPKSSQQFIAVPLHVFGSNANQGHRPHALTRCKSWLIQRHLMPILHPRQPGPSW